MGYCSKCNCSDCVATRKNAPKVGLTMTEMAQIDLGREIIAIKSIRNRTGINLKDAKLVVDDYKHT